MTSATLGAAESTVWDDLVGQDAAVAELRAAAQDPSRMTHAWLITGPPGSGRSVAARAFAAALQDPSGLRSHAASVLVAAGTHPDVTVVATEAAIMRREDVTPLIEIAHRSPMNGRYRVIIIEDADRLNDASGNALLKVIEEPPPRTVWIFCAPSPEDVLITIRSRSRSVGLRVPSPEDVAALLVRRDGIDPAVALQAARAAQSHVGVARRLARDPEARARRDQVLAIAGRVHSVPDAVLLAAELVEVATSEAKAATEEREAAERAELMRALGAEGEKTLPPAVRAQIRDLEKEQKRRATRAIRDGIDRALLDLLSLWRDVLVTQVGAEVSLVNTDQAPLVGRLAQAVTADESLRRLDAIGEARTRLGGNVAPLLAVEAMLLELRT